MPSDYAAHKDQVRDLNDQLRSRMHPDDGKIMLTSGVAALEADIVDELIEAVRTYDAFTPDTDPYGEHDFGKVNLSGHAFFWKIDTFDSTMSYHSPRPWDTQATVRVLTIMLADEY